MQADVCTVLCVLVRGVIMREAEGEFMFSQKTKGTEHHHTPIYTISNSCIKMIHTFVT